MALQIALLVLFLFCGFIYQRASREVLGLERLRLEKESAHVQGVTPAMITKAVRQMKLKVLVGSEELKEFCGKNGLADAYQRAVRRMYGAMLVAGMCIYFIIRFAPAKAAL
jgi:hypothetical protein